jgi:hypothetical protein
MNDSLVEFVSAPSALSKVLKLLHTWEALLRKWKQILAAPLTETPDLMLNRLLEEFHQPGSL